MMSEKKHFEAFVDYIMSDDISEINDIRAERDYALHCLEREIAICAQTQARNNELVKAVQIARQHLTTLGGDPRKAIVEHGDAFCDEIQAAVLDELDAALASIKEPS